MTEQAGKGGESTFIDGLAIARTLREKDPAAYETLSEVEVSWSYHGVSQKGWWQASGTILRVDRQTGDLLQFRWSNKDRDRMIIPHDKIDAFYDAYNKIVELIYLLDMSEFCNRRASGFSQGQKMKVALARALIHDPQYILLDEPTNGLDVMATRAIRKVIHDIKAAGKCVLFSSHVMQEVSALCDHIVVIARGRVVAQGSPDALRERTGAESLADAFVAIIGSEEGLVQ